MTNPHFREFQGRVARIETAWRHGHGFEAAGTLGRSYYTRRHPGRLRIPVMGPVLILLCAVIGLKTLIHQGIGGAVYDARVAELWLGSGVEQIGAVIMQSDPITLVLSQRITELRQ